MRIAAYASLTAAIIAFVSAAILAMLPSLLKDHVYRLRLVQARFKTPAEQYELAANASRSGEKLFNALYDPLTNEQIDAYVPPRSSLAYWILRGVSANPALASKEDFLPAPPAPMAFEFINTEQATPLRTSECDDLRMRWLFYCLCIGTLSLIAIFALRRWSVSRPQPSLDAGRR